MTKNRRIFPSAAPEPASPLTEAPRHKRKNWRSWLTIQVESERYQPPRSGILLLQVLVGIFFFVFVTRFWYLQLHLGPEMTTQAQKNRLRTERIFAPRGRIFDDHGNILADNRTAYGLAIIREDCPDIPATLAQISQWTDTPLEQLQNRYNQDRFKTKPFEALPLVSGLDFGQVARIEAELVNWPGLEIMVRTNRYYPEKDLFAHVLGYVAEANSAEMEKDPDLAMGDLVGKAGVEKAFEPYLRGRDGKRLITTDENGKLTGELYTREPQPGGTVALTLDIDLQADVEQALANTISGMIDKDSNERGGAAAVVSVGSGEVLALASYPSYDLSTFNEDYETLVADERLPMFNRATQGVYAPGSTFKMCTAVAALESGIITPSSIIQDRGIYTYYTHPQPMCWVYQQGGATHGRINVSQAITVSCNYFFYEVGRLTGIRTLDSYASQFGLGSSTGIEIGDSSGVLASPEWADSHNREWTDGQTITAAIGQSYNLFTPLQLANYIATLVGGGEHYQAHLLKNVKEYDNSRLLYVYGEEPLNIVEMSDSTVDAVTKGMHDLTVSGSVAFAFQDCVVSAGAKTGSAQVGTDIANGVFVAYAPYENPEIAVAIVIEKGGSGAALATTAVEIINSWFSRSQDGSAAVGENTLLK